MNNSTRSTVIHWLAVHRLVQLWTTDRVARPLRVSVAWALYKRAGKPEHMDDDTWANLAEMSDADFDDFARDDDLAPAGVYLLYCWWCFGLWASIGYTVLARLPFVRRHVSPALATSTAVVIVSHVVARLAPADK